MSNLVDLGGGNWVNPRYVTSVEYKYYPNNPHRSETLVWVVKDAGYGTGTFSFPGDRRNELATIINQETPAAPKRVKAK